MMEFGPARQLMTKMRCIESGISACAFCAAQDCSGFLASYTEKF